MPRGTPGLFHPQILRRSQKEEQLLTQSLDEETVKQAVGLLKDPKVRHLLFSASTRAGTFVPTIEILARIYLSLRKRNDVNPGQRLAIQEEVLLRYQKSAYTEAKAKRAGSLAINYFSDYLVEYGMKVYKDRFDSAPEGQNNIESHWRRHDVIKSHCFGVFDQWGTRVGLSAHASTNLKARFAETADLFLKETVGDNPNAEPEEGEN